MKQSLYSKLDIKLGKHCWSFSKAVLKVGLTLLFAASSSSAFALLKYDPTTPLYDNDKSAHSIGDIGALLSDASSKGQRVVFYLHGRGAEPEKSFNAKMTGGGAVGRLSTEYGVRVILIGWNSKATGKDRSEPLTQVDQGAGTLGSVLNQLIEFQRLNPNVQRPSLLVHSMGSIVLATLVQQRGWPEAQGKSIFSNILFSEPDADSQGHAGWLSKVSSRERVYVTQNTRDSVLKLSTDSRTPNGNFALGLEPVEPLASNAKYVNLTEALKVKRVLVLKLGAHQVFSKSWMGGNVNTCIFVTKALLGEKFEPDEIAGVTRQNPGRFRFAANLDKKHSCFKNEAVGGDKE